MPREINPERSIQSSILANRIKQGKQTQDKSLCIVSVIMSNLFLFLSRHDDINRKSWKSDRQKSAEELELQEFFL